MERDVRLELYLALVVLGADEMLLRALHAWREGVDDSELLADLRNWNDAKVLEMKEWLSTMTGAELEAARERIRQYEELRAALSEQARTARRQAA
jgi:hypothetical protein